LVEEGLCTGKDIMYEYLCTKFHGDLIRSVVSGTDFEVGW
jgi:hypothetical protein